MDKKVKALFILGQTVAMALVMLASKSGEPVTELPAVCVIASSWLAIGAFLWGCEKLRQKNVSLNVNALSALEIQWLAFCGIVMVFGPLGGKIEHAFAGVGLVSAVWLAATVQFWVKSKILEPQF